MLHSTPVASFTMEVKAWWIKRQLVFNGRLANHGLTSLVNKATGGKQQKTMGSGQFAMVAFIYFISLKYWNIHMYYVEII